MRSRVLDFASRSGRSPHEVSKVSIGPTAVRLTAGDIIPYAVARMCVRTLQNPSGSAPRRRGRLPHIKRGLRSSRRPFLANRRLGCSHRTDETMQNCRLVARWGASSGLYAICACGMGTRSDNGGGFPTWTRCDAYHPNLDRSCFAAIRFRIGECLEDAGVDFIVCESLELRFNSEEETESR